MQEETWTKTGEENNVDVQKFHFRRQSVSSKSCF